MFSWPWQKQQGALPVHVSAGGRPCTRVLVTGAAGQVATMVLPLLRAVSLNWRLTDERPTTELKDWNDIRTQGLGVGHAPNGVFDDIDAVIHFAAQSKPAADDVLQRLNVDMVQWLLDQMQRAGVRRLVYASSMHVMGGYTRRERVSLDQPPRPSSAYGVSKAAAEALIRAAAPSFQLEAMMVRIGHATQHVSEAEPANWLATDDLARLIAIGLTHPAIGVTTVHAVTPHAGDDLGQRAFAERFAMRWRTDAPSYSRALKRLPAWYGDDKIARELRGGVFASGRA